MEFDLSCVTDHLFTVSLPEWRSLEVWGEDSAGRTVVTLRVRSEIEAGLRYVVFCWNNVAYETALVEDRPSIESLMTSYGNAIARFPGVVNLKYTILRGSDDPGAIVSTTRSA